MQTSLLDGGTWTCIIKNAVNATKVDFSLTTIGMLAMNVTGGLYLP